MNFTELITKYQNCPLCHQNLEFELSLSKLDATKSKKILITQEQEIINTINEYQEDYKFPLLKLSCPSELSHYLVAFLIKYNSNLTFNYFMEFLMTTKYNITNFKNSQREETQILLNEQQKRIAKFDFLAWTDLHKLALDFGDLNYKIQKTLLLI